MENHFNCIYCYTNKVNGKKYVGQAVDFEKRHKRHIYSAYNEKCKAYNQYFHNAIRKHGIENFEIEILIENLQNQDELNYWECYYIVEFDTLAKNQKGYNLASGGSNGNTLAGKTDEELAERSRKISEAYHNKSDEEVAEIRRKQSEAYHNKTDEELAEISRKISEAIKGENNPMYGRTGEKHPMYGKQHSEETKAKISESMYGKQRSEETRAKQSEAHKGKNHSEETRAKQSEAHKGEKNPRATLVDRFDKQGNYVDTKYQFEYVTMGFKSSGISNCCKGKRKTHKGYVFKYHNE